MRSRLIGITGYAQHGKGTIAETLKKHYGYEVVSFAAPVKEFLLKLNPMIQTDASTKQDLLIASGQGEVPYHYGVRLSVLVAHYGSLEEVKKRYQDVRQLLQRLGTDAAKPIFGVDCWAQQGLYRAMNLVNQSADVCFDDLRFPQEEGEAILELNTKYPSTFGAEIWRVTRYNEDGTMFDNGIGTDHPSESQIKYFVPDEEIRNDGTLDDLRRKVRELMEKQHHALDSGKRV